MTTSLSDNVFAEHERRYAGTVASDPATLDAHPLAEGDIQDRALSAIVEAVREVRRVRGRVVMPAVETEIAQRFAGAIGERAIKLLREGLPYESDLEDVVTALRQRGACARLGRAVRSADEATRTLDWSKAQEHLRAASEVRADGFGNDPIVSASDAWTATLNRKGERHAWRVTIDPDLDAWVRLTPGSCFVLGAPTNVGKTSLLARWTRQAALNGHPSAIVSLEDDVDGIAQKWLAEAAQVDSRDLRDMRLNESAQQRIADAIAQNARLPLYAVDILDRSLERTIAAMRSLATMGVRLIGLDYLQAIRGDKSMHSARERIDYNLNEILACAKQLGVALILTSQYARFEKGSNREPTLADLKESGTIENAAKYVVLAWREGESSDDPVIAKLAKVKDGAGIGQRFAWRRTSGGTLIACPPPDKRRGPALKDFGLGGDL